MQKGRHAVTDCAMTPADAIGEAFCEERERLELAKAPTTDVGRVGLNCFDYELTCQKVGRKGAPAARRTPWSQHIGPGRVWWHRSKLARYPRRAAAAMAVRERTQAANLVGVTTHDRRQPLPLDARGRRQSSEA